MGPKIRRTSARLTVVALGGALLLGSGTGPSLAHDGAGRPPNETSTDPLAGPFADAVLLAASGPDGAPRLVVLRGSSVRPGDGEGGGLNAEPARLALLARDGETWLVLDEADPFVVPEARSDEASWLVPLGAERFALVSTGPADRGTILREGSVVGEEILLQLQTEMPWRVQWATGADIDGDGSVELVVAGSSEVDPCRGTRFAVLDVGALSVRRTFQLPELRVVRGAVGRLDERPGLDLVADAQRECVAGSPVRGQAVVVGINLTDGQLIHELERGRGTRGPLATNDTRSSCSWAACSGPKACRYCWLRCAFYASRRD